MFLFGSVLCPSADGGGRTCSPASAPFPALDDSHGPFPLCLCWCYLLKRVVHESTRIINMQVGAHRIQIQPGMQHPINQTLTAPDPPGCPPGPDHRLTLPVLEPDTRGLRTLPHSALRHPRGRTQRSLTRRSRGRLGGPRLSQTLLLGNTRVGPHGQRHTFSFGRFRQTVLHPGGPVCLFLAVHESPTRHVEERGRKGLAWAPQEPGRPTSWWRTPKGAKGPRAGP